MSVKRWVTNEHMYPDSAAFDGEMRYVLATDFYSLLAVLRRCVEALERCDKHFQHGAGYVCDALCAAREYLEEAKP